MANIKFSQFTEKTTLGTVDFLVGYTGAENVQISPTNLLSTFVSGSGTNGQVAYFDPSNNLAGENDFFWDYTNNRLGIGTTTPTAKLHVKSSGNGEVNIERASGTLINLQAQSALGVIGTNSNHNLAFKTNSNVGMVLTTGGNVGIGTITPASALDVIGGVTAQGTLVATGISQLGSSGANVYLTSSSAGNVGIGTSGPTYKLHVVSSATPMAKFEGANNAYVDFTDPSSSVRLQNSGHSFFGTQTNTDLRFKTNAAVKMSIQSGGNVGIGTTSPTDTLTISNDNNLLLGLDSPAGNDAQLRFYSAGNYQSIIYRPASSTDLRVNTVTSGDVLTIQQDGNVGIGTTSPSQKLEVVGNIKADSTGNTQVILESGGSCVMDLLNAQSEAYLRTTTAHDLHFRTTNINRMVIKAGGNVGIGTTSPQEKLEVAGNVRANVSNTGGFMLTANSASGLVRESGTGLALRTNTTDRLIIDNSGNATFAGDVLVEDNLYLTDAGTVRGKIQLNSSDRDDLDIKVVSLGSNMKFFTVDTERMRITSSGDVGIGTSSPTSKLSISGSQTAIDLTRGTAGDSKWGFSSDSTALYISELSTGSTDYIMTLKETTGNVGIGTTSPAEKLDVVGNVRSTYDANNYMQLESNSGGGVLSGKSSGTVTTLVRTYGDSYFNGGNFGIGTTSPAVKLEVNGGAGVAAFFKSASNVVPVSLFTTNNAISTIGFKGLGTTSEYHVRVGANVNDFIAYTNNTEKLRITSAGNVGIGTTSPGQKLDVTGGGVKIQSDGSAAAGAYLELKHPNNNSTDICATINLTNNVGGYASIIGGTTGVNNTGYIEFKTDNAGTQGTVLTLNGDSSATFAGTVTIANTSGGPIYLEDTDATDTFDITSISNGGGNFSLDTRRTSDNGFVSTDYQIVKDASGANYHRWLTQGSERMRIDASGNLLIGTTSTLGGATDDFVTVANVDGGRGGIRIGNTGGSSNTSCMRFHNSNGVVGGIRTSGSATAYDTSSDYRLKEDLKDFDGLDKVSKIPVYDFKWKVDNSRSYGVLAHELQEVVPIAVNGKKDAEEMQGVDYSKIVPLLIKSIQELKAEVESLKNK